jgi:hypothetical protein
MACTPAVVGLYVHATECGKSLCLNWIIGDFCAKYCSLL